ncbi:MAG: phosphate acyltransferase PlsX [Bacillota bacterium]|nr:phosphate acyltransferase PlsX [Bacillota bacterium]
MLRVAVDAMGGDYSPFEIVKGVISAVNGSDDLEILLVGSEEAIKNSTDRDLDPRRIKIINAEEVIGNNEDPGLAIRSKKKSSMVTAMRLVREGEADAVISAGNTGALMAGGLLFLDRLSGIKRPALLSVIPSFEGSGVVLLDIGANMDAKPEHLLHYALMGKIYAKEVLGRDNPRVALLNVGIEEKKGNAQVKNAYQLIKDRVTNFVGNVEAKEIFQNTADVLVCDGFVGNVMLKTIEGMARDIFAYLRQEIKKDPKAYHASEMLNPIFEKIRSSLDESEYGGGLLIGLKGVCFKCHGASKEKAITQALLKQVYPFLKKNTNKKIEEALKQNT